MTLIRRGNMQRIVPPVLFAVHLVLHIVLTVQGWLRPFELFNLLLLAGNLITALLILFGKTDFLSGVGIMLVIASHALIGQRIAPDSLTSGAILLVNVLILYVGMKISENLSLAHFLAFIASYFLLFLIFVWKMENAEALFLLSLMGLAATARDLRLLTYFWALVLSFTFCQPYAWQTALMSFFFLAIVFSARAGAPSRMLPIFLAAGLVLVFLVLLPVLILVMEEDPRSIVNLLKEKSVRDAILLTAVTATISTLILTAFSIPLAYAISRTKFFGKPLLLSLMDLPIVIPQSAAGIALLRLFGKRQFLGEVIFDAFGVRFDGTVLGICLAQIFVSMPFIMKSALSAFESVPVRLEHSARTLGASPFGAFRRLAVPLASRGIFAGIVLAWARAAGEFGAVLFVAPYPQTAPVAVYDRFVSVGIVETAPLVTTLLLFSVAMFFILQLAARTMPKAHRTEQQ